MLRFSQLPLAFLATCFAVGCSTPPQTARRDDTTSAAASSPYQSLEQGLTAAQVTALLGTPRQIKPFNVRGVESEIWVYARTIEGQPRPMTTGTRDVPYVDPLTGAARTIKEPVYGYEQTTITEETELLMLDGVLVQWKQQAFSERDFR